MVDTVTNDGRLAVVEATIAEVDGLGLIESDRGVVLSALLRARLGASVTTAANSNSFSKPPSLSPSSSDESDVLERLASVLQVSRDTLELVFDVVDGVPTIVVSAKKIASNKAQAARQLGQLISASRQVAGVEEWTSANTIRKVVQDYGRLDVSNFAATLQQMDDVAVIRGKGVQREVKITKPGIESTAELIRALAG